MKIASFRGLFKIIPSESDLRFPWVVCNWIQPAKATLSTLSIPAANIYTLLPHSIDYSKGSDAKCGNIWVDFGCFANGGIGDLRESLVGGEIMVGILMSFVLSFF